MLIRLLSPPDISLKEKILLIERCSSITVTYKHYSSLSSGIKYALFYNNIYCIYLNKSPTSLLGVGVSGKNLPQVDRGNSISTRWSELALRLSSWTGVRTFPINK